MIFKLNLFPFSRHRTPPPPLPPTFRATVWRIGHSRVRVLLTRVYGTVRVDYTVIYIDNMYFYVVIDFFRGDYYCIIVWWGGSRDGGSTWWLWYIYIRAPASGLPTSRTQAGDWSGKILGLPHFQSANRLSGHNQRIFKS